MHNNYYFLRQLTPRLSKHLVGTSLVEAFSQNRDELILGFASRQADHQNFYIKAYLDNRFCCLQFPNNFHRAKKNSVDLFVDIRYSVVQKVTQLENERSFWLALTAEDQSPYELLFKMHGNRANVILFREHVAIELFKSSLAKDKSLSLLDLNRPLEATYERFERAEGRVTTLYPTLGKVPMAYLKFHDYEHLPRPRQWELLQRTVRQLEDPEYYCITLLEEQLHLSLLPIGDIQERSTDPIEAINAFFLSYIKEGHLLSLRKQLMQRLAKEQKQTEAYLRRAQQRLEQLTTGRSYQQTADLIMANMHAIPANAHQVTLHDFYHQQDAIIKLNAKLTPQKNAENYYRKAKNQKIEVAETEKNIRQREERLLIILAHQEAVAAQTTPRALQEYADEHQLAATTTAATENSLPYRHTVLEGFDVYIGKSAKSNDALLREQAYKDDLWLHAKDVSGSHVLIKQRGTQPFPSSVIEQAARWAAYYSKRKSDTLAPVIYTPRKYVRKGKNMPAGAVRVEREAVILVEPQALNNDKGATNG